LRAAEKEPLLELRNAAAHDEDDPLLLLLPEVVLPEPLLLPLELLLELRPRMRPFFSCACHPPSTLSAWHTGPSALSHLLPINRQLLALG
jgi:hypothetical protein